jgi:hypothetical protein
MRPAFLHTLLLCCALFIGVGATVAQTTTRTAGETPAQNEALRQELLRMYAEDQAARESMRGRWQTETEQRQMSALDAAHTRRLREIFKALHGFPTVSLVGRDGAQAAFIMMIHSFALDLLKQALPYFKRAAPRGEVPMEAYASLIDTILRSEGKPQLYGTRFDIVNGKYVLAKTKDPAHLDARRAKLGLPPWAEYVKGMEETYKMPVDATPPPR